MLGEHAIDVVLTDIEIARDGPLRSARPPLRRWPLEGNRVHRDLRGRRDGVISFIKLGAEDFLPKPFDPVLLHARVGACVEKRRIPMSCANGSWSTPWSATRDGFSSTPVTEWSPPSKARRRRSQQPWPVSSR